MNKYSLRKITSLDLEKVLMWRNSDRVRHYMYNNRVIAWQEHCDWYESLKNRNDCDFQIFSFENHDIGIVSFSNIDLHHRRCNWGFYIGEDHTPKGMGTLMAYCGLEYAFDKYQLNKIIGEVLDFNKSSIAFHKQLCFKEEGVLKAYILRHETYYDVNLFGLLKRDWDNVKDKILSRVIVNLEGNAECYDNEDCEL
jgi:UDP-4-amino-4,6-dideoxy-N-acetyl-beta-L-altrosamine N-acetyltransferase